MDIRNKLLLAAGLAAVSGVLVFGAIYGIGEGSGNVTANCRSAAETAAAINGLNIGDVAAFKLADTPADISALTFNDGEGKQRSLSEWRGKTVLFNLWATWCAPCREEMPALDALQKELGGEAFEVVPVSIDLGTDEKPRDFYAETGLAALPFFHDGKMGVFNTLKKQSLAFGMPTTILIDEDGCVAGSMSGPANWASPQAVALVRKAVEANSR